MKKIQINNFDENIYYLKLDNGLEAFLLPLLNKKNYSASITVKYGGRDIRFKAFDSEFNMPTGIAHFLEHKMFERDNDPFSFYKKSGTDVNASTSYDFTSYYIFGNKSFNNNLKYLIDFIKSIDISSLDIEKEKGIILEEASMYKDSPVRVINEKVKEKVFLKDPYKYKVIGTDDDIKSITKNDVVTCFNSFYNASNMFITIVGNFNLNEAIDIIKEKGSSIENRCIVEKVYEEEPNDIDTSDLTLDFNIDIPREAVAFKFNKNLFNKLKVSKYELDLYLHFLINIAMGPTSLIREKWIKDNLFLNSMYRITDTNTHYVIEFICTTNYPEEIKKELIKYLKDVKLDEESFEREKKLWITGEIESISNINSMKYNIIDDVLDYGFIISNKIDTIKNLKYNTLLELKKILLFKDCTTVKLMPKKRK